MTSFPSALLLPAPCSGWWRHKGCNCSSCHLLHYCSCAAARCWKNKWWSSVVALLDFLLLVRLSTEDEGSSLCVCMKHGERDMAAECGLTGCRTPRPEVGISRSIVKLYVLYISWPEYHLRWAPLFTCVLLPGAQDPLLNQYACLSLHKGQEVKVSQCSWHNFGWFW